MNLPQSIVAHIFDLDGVLVDTAKYHFLAWKRLAEQLGIAFNEKDNERLKGVSRLDSLRIILSLGSLTLSREKEKEYAELKNSWYLEYIHRMPSTDILPGTRKYLQQLKDEGKLIALGSASKNARLILDRLQLTHFFDAIIDGNATSAAKPNPEVFLLAGKALKTQPSQCLVYEDAPAGIEAAHRAGMQVVGIGNPQSLSKTLFTVPSLEYLLKKTKAYQ